MDVPTVPTQCRMCLTECENDKLESMMVNRNDSIDLWTMYDYIMNVGEMCDAANVPHICMKCEADLKSAYLFKVMCTETERTLSELAKGHQTGNETETGYVEEFLDYNIEIGEGDEGVLQDSDEVGEDSSIEIIMDDGFQDSNDESIDASVSQIKTVQETDGEPILSNVLSRKCRKCDLQFESIEAYRIHYRQLHQRAYDRKLHKSNARTCPSCNIQFENVKLYQVHYRRFHKQPDDKQSRKSKVLCSHCGQLFSKSFIGRHIKSKHSGDAKKEHECTTCGKSFFYIENLIMHKRIHSNDKRFACDVCGEKFLHWTTRRNHIRSKHTGEKHYDCHLCGQKFTYNSHLHRHIRRHRNELPHSCSYCSKGFSTTDELKNHQIVHTKVKNESCEVCFKCFGTRKNLQAHMRIHSERNYVCTVCDKRFTQPHVLRTHLKTHPGVEMPERGVILSQKALGRIQNVSKFVTSEN